MSKDIGIAILNWNGADLLERFLPSVIENSPEKEIYVIDNASTDDSVHLLKSKFPQVKIIPLDKNYGFAEGYNRGLKSLDHQFLCLLNSDVRVTPGWLDAPLALMNKYSTIGIVQPKIKDEKNPAFFEYAGAAGGFLDYLGYPYCRGRLFQSIEKDNGQYDHCDLPINWATGACLFIRKEVFQLLGGFDERFFAHQEEIDLCWRARRQQIKVYFTPKSCVYHLGGSTLNNTNPYKTYLNFRNSLFTLLKNLAPKELWQVIFFRMILDGVAGIFFLLQFRPRHTLAILKAHRDFYKNFAFYFKARRAPYILQSRRPWSIVWKHYILRKTKV